MTKLKMNRIDQTKINIGEDLLRKFRTVEKWSSDTNRNNNRISIAVIECINLRGTGHPSNVEKEIENSEKSIELIYCFLSTGFRKRAIFFRTSCLNKLITLFK